MDNGLLRAMRPLDPEIARWLDTLGPEERAQAVASLGAGEQAQPELRMQPQDFGDLGDQPSRTMQSQGNALAAAVARANAGAYGDQPQRTMERGPESGPVDLASLPTDELRRRYHPNQGGFVRREDTGETLFLNGQPGGISETPQTPMEQLTSKFQRPQMMSVIGTGNGTTVQLSPEQAPAKVSLDYTRPAVDVMGGKAYYSKDEPGIAYVLGPDGRPKSKVILGYDLHGSMALNEYADKRAKSAADIAHTQEMTRASQMANPDLGAGGGGAFNTPAVGGEELLKSLEPGVAQQVKAIAEGRQKPPAPIGGRISPLMTLVAQYDPTFDTTDYNARFKTAQEYSAGGQAGRKVQAINQALHHAGQLSDAIDSLNNSDTAPAVVNPVVNWFQRNIEGDTRQGVFQTKANALAAELRKVYASASGGTLEELNKWEKSFDINAGQQQQKAYLKAGMQLLTGAIDSLKENYTRGMGQRADFGKLIAPESQRVMDRILGGGQPAQATGPQIGETRKGYRFKGGDPSSPTSWEKV